ncbi:MAG: SDR family oxidoreductase [Ruminococcaceae bacterium]|nr:SDR family oxidoreductase [Oscillospiraceae bacterium]MBR3597955.1 SDR family oxidoreductase [Clostridia bacterium]
MDRKTAIVTGGSSGIGKETALALTLLGIKVYELSRRESAAEGITHISCDVTDEKAVNDAVKKVYDEAGRIDILINCAGFGISGAVEYTELSQAKLQFDVNFFGTVNVSRAVIPYMREKGCGRIVNISSVAAVAHIPFQTYYSASKAAVESYSFALHNEISPFGISVTAIQPGDISTGFTDARTKSFEGDDIYCGRISRSVEGMEKDERKGMSAQTAGKYIAKISVKKKVKPVYAIGFTYKFLCILCKIFPSSVRNGIVGMLYAK